MLALPYQLPAAPRLALLLHRPRCALSRPRMKNAKCCSRLLPLLLVALSLCIGQAQILFNNKAKQDASPTALSIVLQKLQNVAIKAMK